MPPKAKSPSAKDSSANLDFDAKVWTTADKLRNNMDSAEYKHVVLGLNFLKYISDTGEENRAKLRTGEGDYNGTDPEDSDEYKAENVIWVPVDARWSYLQANAEQPTIGKVVDDAIDDPACGFGDNMPASRLCGVPFAKKASAMAQGVVQSEKLERIPTQQLQHLRPPVSLVA